MNKPTSLSYSAISVWEQCPYKYMRLYDGEVDGKIDRAHAATTVEGSLVHDTLEIWHLDRKKDWRQILKDVAKNKKEQFGDGLAYDILTSNQYTGAFSLLEQYMTRQDIYPKVLDTEVAFDVVLPNGVPVRGRIDRIDGLPNGKANLVDYKTTRTFMWKSDIEESLQGKMYVLVSKYFLYPQAKGFDFTIDALRFKPVTVSFSESQLSAALDYLEVTYDSICSTPAAEAKPRLNAFCGYCQAQDSCPLFQSIKNEGFDKALDFEGRSMSLTPEDHAKAFLEFGEMEVAAKKAKTQAENALDKHMEHSGIPRMELDGYKVYYKSTAYGNPKLTVERKNDSKA